MSLNFYHNSNFTDPIDPANNSENLSHFGQLKSLMEKKIIDFFQHSSTKVNSKKQRIRVEIPAPSLNPLSWLSQQEQQEKLYWSDRNHQFEMAGIGALEIVAGNSLSQYHKLFQELSQNLSAGFKNLRYYGGFRFNSQKVQEEQWKPFGAYRFIIPRFEIFRNQTTTHFVSNFHFQSGEKEELETILKHLAQIQFKLPLTLPQQSIPAFIKREDHPNQAQWADMIKKAIQLFDQQKAEKIVLARKSTFQFPAPFAPFLYLRKLKENSPEAFHFYFQLDSNAAFFGASPERLYYRDHRQIQSEAIAGTRKRGETPAEDSALAQELQNSEKDFREHQFVYDNIRNVLQQYCQDISSNEEATILKLSRVQHLYHSVSGKLKPNISDAKLLQALHPTPAVGGHPKEAALQSISKLEPFDRGWYAGPVGWFSSENVQWVVAIRSGLLQKKSLALYTGAGIVKGSEPEQEWDELENKLKHFLD